MHFSPIIGAMQMPICLLTVVFEVTVLARFDKVLQGSFTQISQSFLTSILTPILTVGYFWDIQTMLWVMVATGYISLYINSYYARKIINYPSSQQLIHMLPTLLLAILVGFLGYYVNSLIINTHLIIRIVSLSDLTVSMYLAISYFLKNDGLSELIILAKKLIQIDNDRIIKYGQQVF